MKRWYGPDRSDHSVSYGPAMYLHMHSITMHNKLSYNNYEEFSDGIKVGVGHSCLEVRMYMYK